MDALRQLLDRAAAQTRESGLSGANHLSIRGELASPPVDLSALAFVQRADGLAQQKLGVSGDQKVGQFTDLVVTQAGIQASAVRLNDDTHRNTFW